MTIKKLALEQPVNTYQTPTVEQLAAIENDPFVKRFSRHGKRIAGGDYRPWIAEAAKRLLAAMAIRSTDRDSRITARRIYESPAYLWRPDALTMLWNMTVPDHRLISPVIGAPGFHMFGDFRVKPNSFVEFPMFGVLIVYEGDQWFTATPTYHSYSEKFKNIFVFEKSEEMITFRAGLYFRGTGQRIGNMASQSDELERHERARRLMRHITAAIMLHLNTHCPAIRNDSNHQQIDRVFKPSAPATNRAGQNLTACHVISLRRFAQGQRPTSDSGTGSRRRGHYVSLHPRVQRCGPKLSREKVLWIGTHRRGDLKNMIQPKPLVYVVKR